MPIDRPATLTIGGIVWKITGKPYQRQTRIEALYQGQYAQCLREYPDILAAVMPELAQWYNVNAPRDTGALQASVFINYLAKKPVVLLGPRKGVRPAAARKTTRRRRRGRPRLTAGFYALPANDRSRKPGYIEDGLAFAARQIVTLCRQHERLEQQRLGVENVFTRLGGRRR